MLVWFTTQYGKSVAIDNQHVTSVYETTVDGNTITNINTLTGTHQVKDSALDVVSRLNTAV